MPASLPPPEPPRAEQRRLRRRASLAAWRRRLARALLRRLVADTQGAPQAQPGRDRRQGDREGSSASAPAGPGDRGVWPRWLGLGRPPERWPRLLLAWQAGLVGLVLALTLQSLLAPRWPRAELPREWGSDRQQRLRLELGQRRLRLLRTLPGRRDPDRALSETLVLEVLGGPGPGPGAEAKGSRAPRQSPGQTERQTWGLMPGGRGAEALTPLSRRRGAAGALELRVVAAQVRKRSDLAVPRLVRDRPDLRLSGVRLERLSPRFSYARGWLRGRPALQTCLTGAAQGGYSEAQLSRLRDQPTPWDWPRISYILGLRDNRDFSCLLLTLSTPEHVPAPMATRQPAGPTSAP